MFHDSNVGIRIIDGFNHILKILKFRIKLIFWDLGELRDLAKVFFKDLFNFQVWQVPGGSVLVLFPESFGGVLCDPVLLHHDPEQRILRVLRLPRLGELQINS
jgi:hypothetical protein